MIRKILVPIAFSKYSKGVLGFAANIAKPLGAHLLIANVVNERDLEAVERISSYGYKVDSEKYVATIQKERVEKLEELVSNLGISDDLYEYTFLAGNPTAELLKLSVRENIDLVVMGTKANDFRHIFTGSVAEGMFRRSPISIISYRDDEIAKELERKIKKELKP